MCTAFWSCDIIYKTICVVTVGIIMLHCHLDSHVVYESLTVDNAFIKRRSAAVQIFYKLFDSTLIMKYLLYRLIFRPVVPQDNFKSLREKGHLSETLLQYIIIKHSLLKDRLVREKCYFCTGLVWITFPDHGQLFCHLAAFITLHINFAFAVYLNFQPVRQSIYD